MNATQDYVELALRLHSGPKRKLYKFKDQIDAEPCMTATNNHIKS